jgi:hypothetical protein
MSNYHVESIDKSAALSTEAVKALRKGQVQGLSRRQLIRGALGIGIGLWIVELLAGTLGFLWPNIAGGFGAPILIGRSRRSRPVTRRCPSRRAFPPTTRMRAPS